MAIMPLNSFNPHDPEYLRRMVPVAHVYLHGVRSLAPARAAWAEWAQREVRIDPTFGRWPDLVRQVEERIKFYATYGEEAEKRYVAIQTTPEAALEVDLFLRWRGCVRYGVSPLGGTLVCVEWDEDAGWDGRGVAPTEQIRRIEEQAKAVHPAVLDYARDRARMEGWR